MNQNTLLSLKSFASGRGRLMVLDVQSIGLHGEGFAYGYVVINNKGLVAETYGCCPSESAKGDDEDREWVSKNVPLMPRTASNPRELRTQFWEAWRKHQTDRTLLFSDACWPVESNFLSACVADNPGQRKFHGPYPLLDISNVLWVAGINPLESQKRTPEEMPIHNPLYDARHSVRKLTEAIYKIVSGSTN